MKLGKKEIVITVVCGTLITFILFLRFRYYPISSGCEFTLPNGNKIDLSALQNPNQDFIIQKSYYTIQANICRKAVNQCNNNLSAKSPAIMTLKSQKCFSLAPSWTPRINQQRTNPLYDDLDLKLTFDQGDKCFFARDSYFHLDYVFKCSPGKEIEFSNVEQSAGCSYHLIFFTKYACADILPPGGSGGNIFTSSKTILLILVFLFGVYLTGFTYKNYKENPEDGVIKALPHRDFWKEFFINTRAGVNFVYNKMKNVSLFKSKDEFDYY